MNIEQFDTDERNYEIKQMSNFSTICVLRDHSRGFQIYSVYM